MRSSSTVEIEFLEPTQVRFDWSVDGTWGIVGPTVSTGVLEVRVYNGFETYIFPADAEISESGSQLATFPRGQFVILNNYAQELRPGLDPGGDGELAWSWSLTVVPEPSSLWLLALCLVCQRH